MAKARRQDVGSPGALLSLWEAAAQVKPERRGSAMVAWDAATSLESVESVAEALFKEWSKELGDYTDPNLRRSSQRKLDMTRQQYDTLIASMRNARSKIDPVLDVLRDQTLYLKHNLNARALSSLGGEVVSMEQQVDELVREMELAIAEANRFIAQMESA